MVVGARRTGLCQELQHCWVFHTRQFPVCIKNGPPANLTTVEIIGVNMGQHPYGMLSTPCRGVLRAKGEGVQLNIRIVFLIF